MSLTRVHLSLSQETSQQHTSSDAVEFDSSDDEEEEEEEDVSMSMSAVSVGSVGDKGKSNVTSGSERLLDDRLSDSVPASISDNVAFGAILLLFDPLLLLLLVTRLLGNLEEDQVSKFDESFADRTLLSTFAGHLLLVILVETFNLEVLVMESDAGALLVVDVKVGCDVVDVAIVESLDG